MQFLGFPISYIYSEGIRRSKGPAGCYFLFDVNVSGMSSRSRLPLQPLTMPDPRGVVYTRGFLFPYGDMGGCAKATFSLFFFMFSFFHLSCPHSGIVQLSDACLRYIIYIWIKGRWGVCDMSGSMTTPLLVSLFPFSMGNQLSGSTMDVAPRYLGIFCLNPSFIDMTFQVKN